MVKQKQTDLSLVHFSPKRRAVFRMLLGFLSLLLLGQGCQKEILQPEGFSPTAPKPASSIGTATYNQAHDVLVFTSFQQVRDLSDALDQLRENYPYNQGNTASIQATMQQIQTQGFYQGSNGNSNQVSLDNFEQLLLNSYPLSNDILLGLMQLNDNLNGALPAQFIGTVMTANVPFTYAVEQAVANANLQNAVKQAILTADDNTTLVPDHAYNDFLSQYPAFNSLYEALEAQDKIDLENGMDPGSQQYDTDFVRDDFLRLILNTEKEVYIAGNLYKMYTDYQMAISKVL